MKLRSILVPLVGLAVTVAGCRHDITDVEPVSALLAIKATSEVLPGGEEVEVVINVNSKAGRSHFDQFVWTVEGRKQDVPPSSTSLRWVRPVDAAPIRLAVEHHGDVFHRLTIPFLGPTGVSADTAIADGQDLAIRLDPATIEGEEVAVELERNYNVPFTPPYRDTLRKAGVSTYTVPAASVAAARGKDRGAALTVVRYHRRLVGENGDPTVLLAKTCEEFWTVKVQP